MIVVLVEFTLVVVPLTVRLPPTVTSPDVAIVVTPDKAPPVKLAVPSEIVPLAVTSTALRSPLSVTSSSRFTVKVFPLPAVVILVPPAMSKVSLSKSILRAPGTLEV